MQEQPVGPGEKSNVRNLFDDLVRRVEAGDDFLGRRLFVVQSGPVDVRGTAGGIVGLDVSGDLVLVVTLPNFAPGAGADMADELDRLLELDFKQIAVSSGATGGLSDSHAKFFELSDGERPELNHKQKVVVVVDEQPDLQAWEELLVELGDQLLGVCLLRDDEVVTLDVPKELRRESGRRSAVTIAVAGASILLLLGAVLLVVRQRNAAEPAHRFADPGPSVARDVIAGVPGATTHNQWIGQDHLVRASDGTLLALYGTEQGLQIVADYQDHGRLWRPPVSLPEIHAVSSSVAIDAADRLHLAFADGSRVAYVLVEQSGAEWATSHVLEVDAAATTAYVDVAYDDESDLAHIVWVEESDQGQAPRWAVISGTPTGPRVIASRRLADPASDVPVLVNVAAGGAHAVATYRRPDSPTGWFARAVSAGAKNTLRWGRQERVPIDAVIGAADVAVDGGGVAHLALRDSTTFQLVYFTRGADGGWSGGETAVTAASIEEIDYPSLTLDRSSKLVYLFFQNDMLEGETGVLVAVRHPTNLWESPIRVSPAKDAPHGAFFPASLEHTAGAPIVLWTAGGASPVLQAGFPIP